MLDCLKMGSSILIILFLISSVCYAEEKIDALQVMMDLGVFIKSYDWEYGKQSYQKETNQIGKFLMQNGISFNNYNVQLRRPKDLTKKWIKVGCIIKMNGHYYTGIWTIVEGEEIKEKIDATNTKIPKRKEL